MLVVRGRREAAFGFGRFCGHPPFENREGWGKLKFDPIPKRWANLPGGGRLVSGQLLVVRGRRGPPPFENREGWGNLKFDPIPKRWANLPER